MTTTYTVNHKAYLKVFLHAAKYPHKRVNGVLVGSSSGQRIIITDAIPLLHNWTNLSPIMSIAMDLTRTYATSVGDTIVGYYQSTERIDDVSLTPVGDSIASRIRESFSDAIALVIDGANLASGEASMVPYVAQGSSVWKPHPSSFSPYSPFSLQYTSSPTRALSLIKEHPYLHRKISDFDEHLENVQLDWLRNAQCNDESFKG